MSLPLRALAALALALCLAPAGARGAVPVVLYPPRGAGVEPETLEELQSLLESALRARARRGVLVPASPLVVPASCPDPAPDACLARLAGAGRVLHPRVRRAGTLLAVSIALVDAAGRRTKSVGFGVDPAIQSSLPVQQALAALETLVEEPAPAPVMAMKPPASDATPARPERRAAASPTDGGAESKGTGAPDLRASPPRRGEMTMRDPEPPRPTPWQSRAGKWTALGGLGLLALGGVVGYLDRSLADELTEAHAQNRLTPSDRSRYDRVKTYNLLANVLYVAGGAAVTTGVVLWAIAPEPAGAGPRRTPARVGVQGRF